MKRHAAFLLMVVVLLAAVGVTGCKEAPDGSKPPKGLTTRPSDTRKAVAWTEVQEFSWGGTSIRRGMTKAEVLSALDKSGLAKIIRPSDVRRPDSEFYRRAVWRLSWGYWGGAATPPGEHPGTAIRVTFGRGKVIKVQVYTGPQPA